MKYKSYLLKWTFVVIAIVFSTPVFARSVPKHLVPMAVDLLESTRQVLKEGVGDTKHRDFCRRAYKIIHQMGLLHWARGNSLQKDAMEKVAASLGIEKVRPEHVQHLQVFLDTLQEAETKKAIVAFHHSAKTKAPAGNKMAEMVEKVENALAVSRKGLATKYSIEGLENGQNIQLKWNPDISKFYIHISDEGGEGREPFRVTMEGKVNEKMSPDGRSIVRSVESTHDAIQAKTATELEKEAEKKFQEIFGEWIDQNGDRWVIQSWEKKPPKHSRLLRLIHYEKGAVLDWKGEFKSGQIKAKRMATHLMDTKEEIPMKVRKQIITNWQPILNIELETILDKETGTIKLNGLYWSWAVTYSGSDYKVKRVHTPYSTSLNLTRKPVKMDEFKPASIKIGNLEISYIGWEVENRFLKYELRKAEEKLRSLNSSFNVRSQKTREVFVRLNALETEISQMEQEIAAQYARLNVVKPSKQTRDYLALQNRVNRAKNWIDKRFVHLQQMQDQPNVPADVIAGLQDEIAIKGDKLKRLEQRLVEEGVRQGIDLKREAKRNKIKQAEDRYWEKRRQLIRTKHEMSQAATMQDSELENYHRANESYSQALLAYKGLLKSGKPLITEIKNQHYLARLWKPTINLKTLNEQIGRMASKLRTLNSRRTRYRAELLEYAEEMTRRSDELISGIWWSYSTQFGAEVADFASDLYNGFSKGGGFPGLAAAVVKKSLEVVFEHPPTYYDAEFDLSDQFAASYTDGIWMPAKQMIKTAHGHPYDKMVKHLAVKALKSEKKTLGHLLMELQQGSWFTEAMRGADPSFYDEYMNGLPRLIDEQTKSLQKVEKAFAKLTAKLEYKSLGNKLVKDFGMGLAKSLGKMTIKKEFAEYFEGKELRKYLIMQYKLSGTARLLLRSSNHYWMTKDAYDTLVVIRNDISQKYDPATQMFVEYSRVKRYDKKYQPYSLLIADQGGDPYRQSQREMKVTLNGVVAERNNLGALEFTIPAEKVKDVGSDEALLRIEVIK